MSKHGQKQLTRARRLKSARKWIASYRGKNLVRGYKKWYGVTDVCAVLELRMLGVDIPDARLEQARRDEQSRATGNARRSQRRRALNASGGSDETFAFLTVYTKGGAPYEITWKKGKKDETRGDDADVDPDPWWPRTSW
ncbi:MAG TPA: hypothetical protein VM890_13415 [Longimicrobium sp.]|nr:hypothetical protein [Longimicrobium sp.]